VRSKALLVRLAVQEDQQRSEVLRFRRGVVWKLDSHLSAPLGEAGQHEATRGIGSRIICVPSVA
jgi:hypothetical protein